MKYLERCVDLPVSKELRDEIKKIKKEKTYDEFLRDLVNSEKRGSCLHEKHRQGDKNQPRNLT